MSIRWLAAGNGLRAGFYLYSRGRPVIGPFATEAEAAALCEASFTAALHNLEAA
jgi:hypothetical protein